MSSPHAGTYRWRDQTFIGLRAVEEASGRSVRTIRRHLEKHGHLECLSGGEKETCDAMPYWIGGRVYPSQGTIARIIGEHRNTVLRWIAEGKTDRIVEKLRETRA